MSKVVPKFGLGYRRKNPRVVRFDHWGAAKSGLQLGEIRTRVLDNLPESGGANWRVDRFHLRLFTAVCVPVQDAATF
jgi:hypothetical protein